MKCESILVGLVPILIIGIMLQKITWVIVALVLVMYIFILNRKEFAIVMLLLMPQLIGLLTRFFNFPIPGSIFIFVLAIIAVYKEIFNIFRFENKKSLYYIIFIVLYFTFLYLATGRTNYSTVKIQDMYITVVFNIIAFYLISTYSTVDSKKIAIGYLLTSALFISLGFSLLRYTPPSGLLDFNSYRDSTILYIHQDDFFVTYHIPGLMAATALAFWLSSKKKIEGNNDYLFIFVTLWIILISGARQAIVVHFLIVGFWIYLRNENNKNALYKTFALFSFCLVFYLIMTNIDSGSLESTFSEQSSLDKKLNRNFDYPIVLIEQNPLFGIGFGNYLNPYTEEIYPHNIFLEILSEQGILSFVLLCFIVISFCLKNKVSLKNRLPNNSLSLIIILPYIVKSLISGDLGSNIVVFVSLFYLYSKKTKIIYKN